MRGKRLAVCVAILVTLVVSVLATTSCGDSVVDSVLSPSLEFEEGVNPDNIPVGSQFRIIARTNSRWEIQSATWYLSDEAKWKTSPSDQGGKIIALEEGEATVSVNAKNDGNTFIHIWRTFIVTPAQR